MGCEPPDMLPGTALWSSVRTVSALSSEPSPLPPGASLTKPSGEGMTAVGTGSCHADLNPNPQSTRRGCCGVSICDPARSVAGGTAWELWDQLAWSPQHSNTALLPPSTPLPWHTGTYTLTHIAISIMIRWFDLIPIIFFQGNETKA